MTRKISAEARAALARARRLGEFPMPDASPGMAALAERAAAMSEAARRAIPPELAANLGEKLAMFQAQDGTDEFEATAAPERLETPGQRLERLAAAHAALRAQGIRNPTETLARQESVSTQRMRQLLSKTKPTKPAPKRPRRKRASPFPLP
jgi:hypothetical protein